MDDLAEQRARWDPRYQPCIPVVTLDGATAHHSLCALLTQADELSTINCTTPGETVAVIEYLMAICFASKTCPSSDEEWRAWIIDGHSLSGAAQWLAAQPDDQWDLFSSEAPLGQNRELALAMAESGTGPAQLVIEHVGDYNQHFDHHHLERGDTLPAADAFRAMLTQHVYAPYGRARISGKVLGATVTNLAAGRLLGRVRVVALGRTLGETLRLNLYPPTGTGESLNTSWTSGSVERRTFTVKAKPRPPQNSADLHSALGRSVLLRPARGSHGQAVVDRVLIGAGEVLQLEPERDLQDAAYVKTTAGPKPLWPSPTRAQWRDAHALYTAVMEAPTGLYARLRQLLPLPHERKVPGALYQMWAVGLLANKTLPVAWIEGTYPYAPALTRHLHRASYRGSRVAEYLADSLRRAAVIASETAYPAMRAANGSAQLARFDGRWEFWPAASVPFYNLLHEVVEAGAVDEDDPASAPLVDYAQILMNEARAHLAHRLDSLPPNDRGNRARARAQQRFDNDVNSDKAPAELRGETAHD